MAKERRADPPASAGGKQDKPQLFKPGQSGNPAGRQKGSRNKLGEAFIEALHDDFQQHGIETIQRVRNEKPDQYLKVVAGLLPKELKITDERDLSDDQLIQRLRQLDDIIRPFLAAEGEAATSDGVGTAH